MVNKELKWCLKQKLYKLWFKTIMLWLKMVNEKIEILKLLIEQEEAISIRKISLLRKINYKTAYLRISELEKENLISINRTGNNSLCKFNKNFNQNSFLAEYERTTNYLKKNKDLNILVKRLSKINQEFILLLFGSQIKKPSKKSDIDLLLISNSKKEIEEELELLPLKTHLTNISYEEFIHMLKLKEETVVSEVVKNNLILFGIENYYRLIKNAN